MAKISQMVFSNESSWWENVFKIICSLLLGVWFWQYIISGLGSGLVPFGEKTLHEPLMI